MQESDVIVVGVTAIVRVYDKRTDISADFMSMNPLLRHPSQVHKQAGCVDTTEYTGHEENSIITRTTCITSFKICVNMFL